MIKGVKAGLIQKYLAVHIFLYFSREVIKLKYLMHLMQTIMMIIIKPKHQNTTIILLQLYLKDSERLI